MKSEPEPRSGSFEHALEPLCPRYCHGWHVYRICRSKNRSWPHDVRPAFSVRRKRTVKARQVDTWLRHQSGKVQRLEDDMGRAVPVRCLQWVAPAHPALATLVNPFTS